MYVYIYINVCICICYIYIYIYISCAYFHYTKSMTSHCIQHHCAKPPQLHFPQHGAPLSALVICKAFRVRGVRVLTIRVRCKLWESGESMLKPWENGGLSSGKPT